MGPSRILTIFTHWSVKFSCTAVAPRRNVGKMNINIEMMQEWWITEECTKKKVTILALVFFVLAPPQTFTFLQATLIFYEAYILHLGRSTYWKAALSVRYSFFNDGSIKWWPECMSDDWKWSDLVKQSHPLPSCSDMPRNSILPLMIHLCSCHSPSVVGELQKEKEKNTMYIHTNIHNIYV